MELALKRSTTLYYSHDEDDSESVSESDSLSSRQLARSRTLSISVPIPKADDNSMRNPIFPIDGVLKGSCVHLRSNERRVSNEALFDEFRNNLMSEADGSSESQSSNSPMTTSTASSVTTSSEDDDRSINEIRKDEFLEFECSVLGYGVSTRVVKAIDCKTAKIVALKRADMHDKLKQAENEISVIDLLPKNCPQLVQIYAFWLDTDTMENVVVSEYMNVGSLKRYIQKWRWLNEETCRYIAFELSKGLAALHAKNLIHCDFKLDNILLDTSGTVKICDYGLLCKAKDTTQQGSGTLKYFSPERLDNCFDSKADVWGLGLCLYECAEGIIPARSGLDQERWIKEEHTVLSEKYSKNFQNFVSCCLQKDPELRWSSQELLKHPFIVDGWKKRVEFVSTSGTEELLQPVIRLLRKYDSVCKYHENATCVQNIAGYCGLTYEQVRVELSKY